MQARLTDKVLFPLVVFYFKTFWHVGALCTESGSNKRFYKKLFLNRESCCRQFYYVESFPVNFKIRMLKVIPKMKTRLGKGIRPIFF